MVNLRKMNLEEINRYPYIISQVISLYGEITDDFYEYEFNDSKRVLYRCGNYFTMLSMEGEYVVFSSFCLGEEYNLDYMEFGEFCASKNGDRDDIWEVGSGTIQNLSHRRREDSAVNGPYDGLVTYSQINEEAGEGLMITYEVCYSDRKKVYPGMLRDVFMYSHIQGSRITNYACLKANVNTYAYDIMTIKDYGLQSFLENGAYALQKDDQVVRYFKVLHQLKDGTQVTLYPVAKQYTKEELCEMFEARGFKVEIPEYLFEYHNGEYEEIEEYAQLAEAIKAYDKEQEEINKLQKK